MYEACDCALAVHRDTWRQTLFLGAARRVRFRDYPFNEELYSWDWHVLKVYTRVNESRDGLMLALDGAEMKGFQSWM